MDAQSPPRSHAAGTALAVCIALCLLVLGGVAMLNPALRSATSPQGWLSFEDCAFARNCGAVVGGWSGMQSLIAALLLGVNCAFVIAYTAGLSVGLRLTSPRLPVWLGLPGRVLAWAVIPASLGDLLHKLQLFHVLVDPHTAAAREPLAAWAALSNLVVVLPAFALLLVHVGVLFARRRTTAPAGAPSAHLSHHAMPALSIRPGGGLEIVEAPMPSPSAGEVLVEVSYSAVNGMDVEVAEGGWTSYARRWRREGPTLTGIEFSGTACSDGARIRRGDRVIGYSHVLKGPRTHRRFVAMPERDLQTVPPSIDSASAAALVVGGLTAIAILENIRRLKPGEHCLIVGAAGGVGCCAVQLAAASGAQVTVTGSPGDTEWLKSLGAHHVRHGRGQDIWQHDEAFDLIVDTPALLTYAQAAPHLRPGGTFVSTHPEKDLIGMVRSWFSRRRFGWLMVLRSNPAALRRLLDLAEAGTLKPVIDSIHPLAGASAAFARVAGRGKRGRVLLRIAAEDSTSTFPGDTR